MPDFQLRDDYSPYPANPTGACVLCNAAPRDDFEGTGRRERIVDTGTTRGFPDRTGEGQEEFCESCVVSMGRVVGMASLADVERAEEAATAATAEADRLGAQVADLRTALDALTRAAPSPATDTPDEQPVTGLFTDIITDAAKSRPRKES